MGASVQRKDVVERTKVMRSKIIEDGTTDGDNGGTASSGYGL